MPINFNNVDNIYHGTTPIKKVYRGSVVEWDGHDYFYIENTYNGSNTLTLTTTETGSPAAGTYTTSVEYSKDKISWTTLTLTTSSPKTINMNVGEKVYFRNTNGVFNYTDDNAYFYTAFSCSEQHNAGGNINTLLDYTNLDSISLPQGCFNRLFNDDSNLIDASNIKLPSLVLSAHSYRSLFYNCTSLTSAPELPATTLATSCYRGLFFNNSSLVNAPTVLPATTLAPYCYRALFWKCSSLTSVPELPATTLVEGCYIELFGNCSLVNKIVVYAQSWNTNYTSSFTYNVAATGEFFNLGGATIPTSVNGIPTGWIQSFIYPAYFRVRNEYSGTNTITLSKVGSPNNITLDYSTNSGSTWNTWNSANGNLSVNLSSGQSVYFKGDNSSLGLSGTDYYTFSGTQNHAISGDLVSLYDSTMESDEVPNRCFYRLFYNDTKLISSGNSIITATTFGEGSCISTFSECTNLTTSLKFTIKTAGGGCCNSMFDGATNLTDVSGIHLDATTLPQGAYKIMFRGTKIVDAPEIMATSYYANSSDTSNGSLAYMFSGCSSLNTIKVHFTSWNSGYGTKDWTRSCKSSGKFYKPSSLPSTKNTSGNTSNPNYIPYNWTVSTI